MTTKLRNQKNHPRTWATSISTDECERTPHLPCAIALSHCSSLYSIDCLTQLRSDRDFSRVFQLAFVEACILKFGIICRDAISRILLSSSEENAHL